MVRALQLEPKQPEPPEVVCPYCDGAAEFFQSSAHFFGGHDYGPLWACLPCHAWVGVHRDTRRPLGRLADEQTRRLRTEAHRYFDHLWHRKLGDLSPQKRRLGVTLKAARAAAYEWLGQRLGMTRAECHIGLFDAEQCREVIAVCKPFYNPAKLAPWVREWAAQKAGKTGSTKLHL